MYTLRIFKNKQDVKRSQFFLGSEYHIEGAGEEDKKLGNRLRVFGDAPNVPSDGFCIHEENYAFIMMPNGSTLETLNRPEWHKEKTPA